jgi:pimeloyl-ACP methyl ester carboxylesterase
MSHNNYADLYALTPDGLRLHWRDYGDFKSPRLPVICLPGLTRNTADFHDIACRLSQQENHRVISLDSRGRGLSDWAKNASDYTIAQEMSDLIHLMDVLAIKRAHFLGTSRGGLILMALATVRPYLIASTILNDIGPVIEAQGLLRIKSYVGKSVPLQDFTQARMALAKTHGPSFPALTEADWDMFARATWNETDKGLVLSYDPKISESLKDYDPSQPAPDLWPLWNALVQAPCLIIRGEKSDLFTDETAKKMAQGHEHCTIHTVTGQGHAPLLRDQPTLEAIARFLQASD